VAGARTDGAFPPGTQTQVLSYLTRPGALPGAAADPTGLYVLFAGGNDLRDAGGLADPVARQTAAAAAAQRVVTQAGLLAGNGARNVLLFTLPSLGVHPRGARPARAPGDPRPARRHVQQHARRRHPRPAGRAARDDVLQLPARQPLRQHPRRRGGGGAQYGFTNVTTPCLPPYAPPGAPSCDVSVFADDLHPTTRVHALIGRSAFTYVTTGQNVQLVPEPATLVLFGAGAVALAAVARRRRAA
jgi:outer membrane lipase/esterase